MSLRKKCKTRDFLKKALYIASSLLFAFCVIYYRAVLDETAEARLFKRDLKTFVESGREIVLLSELFPSDNYTEVCLLVSRDYPSDFKGEISKLNLKSNVTLDGKYDAVLILVGKETNYPISIKKAGFSANGHIYRLDVERSNPHEPKRCKKFAKSAFKRTGDSLWLTVIY
jgi:hypothetical protein